MAQLSDEEIQDIAAEAGISPTEVRKSLAEQGGGNLPAVMEQRGMMLPSNRGTTVGFAEGRVPMVPDDAARKVKEALEKRVGTKGHMQGKDAASVVDDKLELNYHVRSEDDGEGGALVRVDIDPSHGKGRQALATAGLVTGVGVLALGGLAFSTLMWAAVGLGALGGVGLFLWSGRRKQAVAAAHAIAAEAVAEAENAAPAKALPPA